MDTKPHIDVQLDYLEDLTEVNINLLAIDGKSLSAQDILNAVSEALLLKYPEYDLDPPPEAYDA